jgi:AcrR family transcriptional regulator
VEASSPGTPSGRERVLATAYELFSRHGTRAVGVDRIIEESGVAKMTLYRNFASTDELILAFLERREAEWTRAWLQGEGGEGDVHAAARARELLLQRLGIAA